MGNSNAAAETVKADASVALVSRRDYLQKYLDKRTDQLAKWARGGLKPDELIRFTLLEWSKSPQLQACTPDSLYLALIACAQLGLEPSGLKQEAFIVPYNVWNPRTRASVTIATFQPGWRGLVKLARRSGVVTKLYSHAVYEHDIFEVDLGTDAKVVHRPAMRERGALIGSYALAKMEDGEFEIELMSLDDLEKIRAHAKKGEKETPAYREWADQMYRKAPIRRLCKRLPLGDDYFRAARADELLEGGDVRGYKEVIDVEGELPDLAGAAEPPAEEQEPRKTVTASARVRNTLQEKKASRQAPAKDGEPGWERDPLEREVDAIRQALETPVNPDQLPALRVRVQALPETYREDVSELLAKAEVAAVEGA